MAYIKIIFGLLVWGAIFFYFGSDWLNEQREKACLSEANQDKPNLKVLERRCMETAERYIENNASGTAAWFYLLGGAYQKNIDELEPQIENGFYMNIGHSYILAGEFDKAKAIYEAYPWSGGMSYLYADEGMQGDYKILPRIYGDKKENLEKGLALWNEIYQPIEKVVDSYNTYEIAKEESEYGDIESLIPLLKEYLEQAYPFREKEEIAYIKHKRSLAQYYSNNNQEDEAIALYSEIVKSLEENKSKQPEYIASLLELAAHYQIVDYKPQLKAYEKCLAVVEECNSSEVPSKGAIYDKMGDACLEADALKEASLYYQKGLSYREKEKVKSYEMLMKSHRNLAGIELMNKEYESYDKHNQIIIDLAKEEILNLDKNGTKEALSRKEEVLASLDELYRITAIAYDEVNQTKAQALREEHIAYLEKHHDKRVEALAIAYLSEANIEKNASKAFALALKGINHKMSVIERLTYDYESENENLFNEYYNLQTYMNRAREENNVSLKEEYDEALESLMLFEESVFEDKHLPLAKTYHFLSGIYPDNNRTVDYAKRSIKELETFISDTDKDMKEEPSRLLDTYTVELWKRSADSNESDKLIEEYLKFKGEQFEENPDILALSYQVVGDFYREDKQLKPALDYYSKAIALDFEDDSEFYGSSMRKLFSFAEDESLMDASKGVEVLEKVLKSENSRLQSHRVLLSEVYMNLGMLHKENNNSKMLAENDTKSVRVLYDEVKENNNTDNLYTLQEMILHVVGNHAAKGEKEKAVALLDEFLTFVTEKFPDDKKELAVTYDSLANGYEMLKDKEHRLFYREKAFLVLSKEMKNRENFEKSFELYLLYSNYLVMAYTEEQEPQKTKEHLALLKKFLTENEGMKKSYKKQLLFTIAEDYLLSHNYVESLNYLVLAKELSQKEYRPNCDRGLDDLFNIYVDEKALEGLIKACKARP